MKRAASFFLALVLALSLAACGGADDGAPDAASATTYTVGICSLADNASLRRIVASIRTQLDAIGTEKGVAFVIKENSAGADAMDQIIAGFQADQVDLMVGVATPVAVAMRDATAGTDMPVVFAAVSDPEGAGLVASNAAPGANITGTSDYLDADAVMELIFAAEPDAGLIGLLYNANESASADAVAAAKTYLDARSVAYVERTGTTVDEVIRAARSLADEGVDAVFTPTDNTVMTAEPAIYEIFADAGIPHYAGADSFALSGAFLGYGVDYANLGVETANMIADILLNGTAAGSVPVKTFDGGVAAVNTEICAAIGFDYDDIAAKLAPYCTGVQSITTVESFDDTAS